MAGVFGAGLAFYLLPLSQATNLFRFVQSTTGSQSGWKTARKHRCNRCGSGVGIPSHWQVAVTEDVRCYVAKWRRKGYLRGTFGWVVLFPKASSFRQPGRALNRTKAELLGRRVGSGGQQPLLVVRAKRLGPLLGLTRRSFGGVQEWLQRSRVAVTCQPPIDSKMMRIPSVSAVRLIQRSHSGKRCSLS